MARETPSRWTARSSRRCLLAGCVGLLSLFAAAGANAQASPATPGALRVCLLEDDAPRAHRATGRGFDLEVMAAIAADVGIPFEPVWSPSRSGFSEIESTDLPLDRLARGECDAAASIPGEQSLGRLRDRFELSRPYYGAAFELVTTPDGPATIEALRGRRLGVQLQSFAHIVAQSLGFEWRTQTTPGETIAMVDAGEVDAALVWGPALAPLGRAPDPRWTPPRALRWNEHVAVRRGSPWLVLIDRSLERLTREGAIERMERAAGIPPRGPFAGTSDASALAELRQRAGA